MKSHDCFVIDRNHVLSISIRIVYFISLVGSISNVYLTLRFLITIYNVVRGSSTIAWTVIRISYANQPTYQCGLLKYGQKKDRSVRAPPIKSENRCWLHFVYDIEPLHFLYISKSWCNSTQILVSEHLVYTISSNSLTTFTLISSERNITLAWNFAQIMRYQNLSFYGTSQKWCEHAPLRIGNVERRWSNTQVPCLFKGKPALYMDSTTFYRSIPSSRAIRALMTSQSTFEKYMMNS